MRVVIRGSLLGEDRAPPPRYFGRSVSEPRSRPMASNTRGACTCPTTSPGRTSAIHLTREKTGAKSGPSAAACFRSPVDLALRRPRSLPTPISRRRLGALSLFEQAFAHARAAGPPGSASSEALGGPPKRSAAGRRVQPCQAAAPEPGALRRGAAGAARPSGRRCFARPPHPVRPSSQPPGPRQVVTPRATRHIKRNRDFSLGASNRVESSCGMLPTKAGHDVTLPIDQCPDHLEAMRCLLPACRCTGSASSLGGRLAAAPATSCSRSTRRSERVFLLADEELRHGKWSVPSACRADTSSAPDDPIKFVVGYP